MRVLAVDAPAVLRVPVRDIGEPVVDLRDLLPMMNPQAPCWVRAGLALRLARADALLGGRSRLLVAEGFRSSSAQARIRGAYVDKLIAANPHADMAEVAVQASLYVAPASPAAPHLSGGAVDVTLCSASGVELNLGSPLDSDVISSGGRCFTDVVVAQPWDRNRRLLVGVLSEVGLVNYPAEWWHWSYGDRYWAAVTGQSHAVYGPADRLPELVEQ